MSGPLLGVIAIVVIAFAFDYTNGFHDAANAIATAVSTRALTPRAALVMAAAANLLGSVVTEGVAKTVGSGIITAPTGSDGLVLVFSALVGAIAWNLITWRAGLPSSSSHALIGGLVGAGLAASSTVHWSGVLDKVVVPMVLSPVIGFGIAYVLMLALLWAFRSRNPHRTVRGFRHAQIASAAAMAFGHGLQDAQKTMGVVVLALVTYGAQDDFDVPLWVKLGAALAISLGTYSGGWRIMRTLGRKVIELDPPRGFTAETTAAGVLYATSFLYAVPVSTTHVITSSIMGVGATRRLSAVRWGVAGTIATAWVLTIPAAAVVAAVFYLVAQLVVG